MRMTRREREEELCKAAELIKKYCHSFGDGCEKCLFRREDGCGLKYFMPRGWEVPEPRRFTDKDINLAQALQAFGCRRITRYKNCEACVADYGNRQTPLPVSAFKGIEEEEVVDIDDIIDEGE